MLPRARRSPPITWVSSSRENQHPTQCRQSYPPARVSASEIKEARLKTRMTRVALGIVHHSSLNYLPQLEGETA